MSDEPAGLGGRRVWEQRWAHTADGDFEWSLGDEVAPQLRELVEATPGWSGAALDLGCGAGVSTRFLAEHLQPALGVDIAAAALSQAAQSQAVQSQAARSGSGQGWFAAADALALPVAAGVVGLVYDRGCLQNLPEDRWGRYFAEVARVMAPGATLLLLVSKQVAGFAPVTSAAGLRQRYSWYVKGRRRGPQGLDQAGLRAVAEPHLRVESMSDFDFVTTKGKTRRFTHAVMTRPASA